MNTREAVWTQMLKTICYLCYLCLVLFVLARFVMAADNPEPYTIHPVYHQTVGVSYAPPENNEQLRGVLAAALGADDRIDPNAYYLIHRVVFNILNGATTNGGWYLYHEPWHRSPSKLRRILSRLDDPLVGGNFRRKRIYGAGELQLVPVVLWPALDLSKHNPVIRNELAKQVATAVSTNAKLQVTGLLTSRSPQQLNTFLSGYGAKPTTAADFDAALKEAITSLDAVKIDSQMPAIARDAEMLKDWRPQQAGAPTGAAESEFIKAYAAWIVRETLAAYAINEPKRAPRPAEIRFVNSQGKQLPVQARLFTVEPSSATENRTGITRFVPQGFPEATTLSDFLPDYKITITAREPQPTTDFKGLLGVLGLAQADVLVLAINPANKLFLPLLDAASVATEPVRMIVLPADVKIDAIKPKTANAGSVAAGPQPVPAAPKPAPAKAAAGGAPSGNASSSGTATGNAGSTGESTAVLASIQLVNEKKYAYGIGAGIPLQSYDTLEYDSTNGVITSKAVEKQNLFAFLLLHPYPTDTSGTRLRLLPGFMAGLPIAGKPLNQQIYAGSIGLWKVEPFVGVRVTRTLVPTGASTGSPNPSSTAGSLRPDWGTRLTFGITVPISSVKSLISPQKGGGASNAGAAAAGTPGSRDAKKN